MSNQKMRLSPEYYRLIQGFEKGKRDDPNCRLTASGAALDAYLCPADVWTIGAGSTKLLDGSPVKQGDTITEEEVFLLAERDAEEAASAVRKIQRPLKPHQFDALTSFTQNLGEGNLQRLFPLIEDGRWEDVAEKMYEYVRAWQTYEGKPYFAALLGLRIRRIAEGLLLNGREWQDVCDADNIGMPRQKPPEWQPEGPTRKKGVVGRYYDILLPGATEYTTIEAMSKPLASLDLVLTTKAEPAPSVAQGKAGQPEYAPQPAPAAPAPTKPVAPPLSGSGATGPVAAPSAPQVPQKPLPVPASTKPPPVPAPMPPSVQVNNTPDYGPGARNMFRSKRFWGGLLIIGGRFIVLLDVSGNFAPFIRSFIGDGVLMDWSTGVIVNIVGEWLLDKGEKKAEGPMDTPKRVALMTPAP